MQGLRTNLTIVLSILGMLFSAVPTMAQELPPGRLFNPLGTQFDLATTYNSEDDEYLLVYANAGVPNAVRMTPAGILVGNVINVGGSNQANLFGAAYNPDRNEYLYIYRNDNQSVGGQFIAGDGTLIGNQFSVGTGGNPRVQYSSGSQNYMVVFDNLTGGFNINYTVVNGDSSLPNPIIVAGRLIGGAFSPDLTYSPTTDRYFVCFVRDFSPPTRANVYGRYFDASTLTLGGEVGIGVGFENQQTPRCAHSVEGDRVLVQFEDWVNAGANSADIGAHYVEANGAVSARFYTFQTPGSGGWDVPGPLAYNSLTRTFIASSTFGATAWYLEVDPAAAPPASGVGTLQFMGGANLNATDAVGRPDGVDPQVLFISRISFGADGVHANIAHLPSPPPTFSSNLMPAGFNGVTYSEMVPIVGGTPPLTFAFVPGFGTLPPGLSGPDPNTGLITGTPTQFGSFPFRVKATDSDTPARSVEGDVTLTITLPPPMPSYPMANTAINTTATPFSWTGVGGAAQYQIQVDNLTTATNNVIDETIAATTHTMAGLTDGNYRWRVRSIGGGNDSPFTPNVNFELDTTAPSAPDAFIASAGGVPVPIIGFAGSTDQPGFPKTNLTDANFATAWRPLDQVAPVGSLVDLVLDTSTDINKVRLRSLDTTAEGFPVSFQIQTAQTYPQFTTVASVTNFTAAANTWYDFNFPTTTAGFVRINVTTPAQVGNVFRVEIAEVQVIEAAANAGTVGITWNAPGDDGAVGTADSYDLRYMIGPMGSFNYNGATPADNEPTPAVATTPQSTEVANLMGETVYTFGMRARDNANNDGAVALSEVTTPGIPPEPVTDLSASTAGPTSVSLSFTAPHEDANMGAAVTSYEIRYSQSPINAGNFSLADLVMNPPAPPKTPGMTETLTVANLQTNTLFYFALISRDDVGNVSLLSNVATGETDAINPGPVTNFMAMPAGGQGGVNMVSIFANSGEYGAGFTADLVIDGNPSTLWSTPGRTTLQPEFVTLDLGTTMVVDEVRLRAPTSAFFFPIDFTIEFSTDGTNFNVVHSETGFASTAGTLYTFSTASGVARYIKVQSTLTNEAGGTYFAQVAEVEFMASAASGSLMLLSWTSSGDDGTVGTATEYDIRYQAGGSLDFDNAMQSMTEPAPLVSGTGQSHLIVGLDPEATYTFGIKAIDDGGNVSTLAMVTDNTEGVPPEAITGLTTQTLSGTSIRLLWNAPHEDGNMGDAVTSYEIKYSLNPIDENNFAMAMDVMNPPAPAAPTTPQSVDVPNLTAATQYYFAMISRDELGNASPLSNLAIGFTSDGVNPGPVGNFMAVANSGGGTPTIASSSGEYGAGFEATNLLDGNENTIWSTPGRSLLQVEQFTVDLGGTLALSDVQLRSPATSGFFFPIDFTIELSTDGTNFTVAHTETGFSAGTATWYTFNTASQPARFVRVQVTNTNQAGGQYFVQIADFQANGVTSPGMLLSWISSGDDGANGTATLYDIRYQPGGSIDFNNAIKAMGEPVPAVSGTNQSFIVANLSPETQYTFGIRTEDEGGNVSTVVMTTQNTTGVAPEPVSDLSTQTLSTTTIRVKWTAPHEDGNMGTAATTYELAFSTTPIDAANFAMTPKVGGMPTPANPGIEQMKDVGSLTLGTQYYFALVSIDDLGNRSAISNLAIGFTADSMNPGNVTGLTATAPSGGSMMSIDGGSGEHSTPFSFDKIIDSDLSTSWSTPGRTALQTEFITIDLGNVIALDNVRLRSRDISGFFFPVDFTIELSLDGSSFAVAHTEVGFVAQGATWYSFATAGQSARYVKVNVTNANQAGGQYFVQIAEFEANGTPSPSMLLSWTSSGDDGPAGTATSYDIRYQMGGSIDFGNAMQAMGEPVPAVSGTSQSFLVTGLVAEAQYTFGIQAADEGANLSGVVSVTMDTPGQAPEAVNDLLATAQGTTSILISWTAPHENGANGSAVTSYALHYSTSPINANNFDMATPVPATPGPAAPDTSQSATLGMLTIDTTYYFALISTDDEMLMSPISNLPSASTFDAIDPGPVTNLSATPSQGLNMSIASSSGEYSPSFSPNNLIDTDPNTLWSTPGRSSVQPEEVTIDLGAMVTVDNVRLLSNASGGLFFPVDFTIQLSTDGTNFTTVDTQTAFVAAAGTWYTFPTGSMMASHVKIEATNANQAGGLYYVQLAGFEAKGPGTEGVTLIWNASGDDGTVGTATTYDIRYQIGASIDFINASQAMAEPTPAISGTQQSFVVPSLDANTQYTFGIQVIDDSNRVSTIETVTIGTALQSVRVMSVGDSITQGGQDHASYRYPLFFALQQAGFLVDFVGQRDFIEGGGIPNPLAYPNYSTTFDREHEGYWGWRTDEVLAIINNATALAQPNIVLIHLGTNDIGQMGASGVTNADTNLRAIIAAIRSNVPTVTILLAQVIPIGTNNSYTPNAGQVAPLNVAISTIAADSSTAPSPIILVDQFTGYDLNTLMQLDGLHPNTAGEGQMSNVWTTALMPLLPTSARQSPSFVAF